MTSSVPESTLAQFTTFGDLLKYARRRAGLTQRELSIAVGYSTAQICRLEQNQRLPDLATLTARFVPELGLGDEPRLVQRLLELASTVKREDAPAAGLPPFKGLLYFDEADTELFFGREALTARLLARLTGALTEPPAPGEAGAPRFLAVVGASGSGKSSLVRAGLIPALRWDPASAGWPVYLLTPTAHPLEALAAALLGEALTPAAQAALVRSLAADPAAFPHTLEQQVQRAGATHAVIVVDQFEELFTLGRDEAERQQFIDGLLVAAGSGPGLAAVVITLRADFYGHCAAYPGLRTALAQRQEYIGGMTADELRRAIEAPAERGHWELEPGLVDTLLQDVGLDGLHPPEPGALPLLSHALLETWQRRRGRRLTLSGYAAAGGVRGAIAETAETVFFDQLTPEQRDTARHIFVRLTELGADETMPDTRRRASLDELLSRGGDAALVREVLTLLADARLITTDQNTAEVAHEALIREWPTLRQWLTENREALRLHRHLTEAALEWERAGRDPELAYRGARLAQALEWSAAHPAEVNVLERTFLDAARAIAEGEAAEREAQRQRELEAARKLAEAEHRRATDLGHAAGQLRRRALYLAGALLLAVTLAGAALFLGAQAQRAAQTAQAQGRVAFSRELAAAAIAGLDSDPERSLLLAQAAVSTTYTVDGTWTTEAEDALHQALLASRIALTLRGHQHGVVAIRYSPTGDQLATASYDNTIQIWDAATGETLQTLSFAAEPAFYQLAYRPDGSELALAGPGNVATVFALASGQPRLTLRGHTEMVADIAYSPDGTRLVTGSDDRTAKVWDAATGQLLFTLYGHTDSVRGVTYNPDGATIATTGLDGTVRLWDADTGQSVGTLTGPGAPFFDVAFSPDGAQVAVGGLDGVARLWDIASGQERLTFRGHTGLVAAVVFSPDGTRLATTSFDGKAKVWDVRSGQELVTLAGHAGPVISAAFRPTCAAEPNGQEVRCGTQLATSSFDGTARVWNVAASQEWVTLALPGHTATALSADGTRLAVGYGSGTVQVWDLTPALGSGAAAARLSLAFEAQTGAINTLAFSPDAAQLAVGGEEQAITLWATDSGQAQLTLTGHAGPIFDLSFSPDGRQLVSAGNDYTLRAWDLATGAALWSESFMGGANAVAIAASCNTGTADCIVRLATANERATTSLWDLATGARQLTLELADAGLDVAFSPDGSRFATTSVDGTARVWDAATGAAIWTLTGHGGEMRAVAFNPACPVVSAAEADCALGIATGELDGSVTLWNAATGQATIKLAGHTAAILRISYSPDGRWLLTDGADGAVRLHLLRIDDLLELARTRVTRALTTAECWQYLHGAGCAPETPPLATETPSATDTGASGPASDQVCEVTDEGGLNDQLFNDLTYAGLLTVAERYGWSTRVGVPRDSANYAATLAEMQAANCRLIVAAVGFNLAEAVQAEAERNPQQAYLMIDGELDPPRDNVRTVIYASGEAAFLAGYAAAAATRTGTVATYGGVNYSGVAAFMNGFALGVEEYNRRHDTHVTVLGWDITRQDGRFIGNFSSTADGRAVGAELLDQGADIVLPVAGTAGVGTAALFQERGNAWIIGVDSDWAVTFPDYADVILTSVQKRANVSVVRAVEDLLDQTFSGGDHLGTLATGEVGLAPFYSHTEWLPAGLTAELDEVAADIAAGKIKVTP